MADYVKVATISQIPADHGYLAETNGKRIAIFKLNGDYCAIDDACTHVGAPLSEGQMMGQNVVCPWHGAQFNLTTGACTPPARGPVKRYPVRVNGSDIEVAIDIEA